MPRSIPFRRIRTLTLLVALAMSGPLAAADEPPSAGEPPSVNQLLWQHDTGG